MSAARSASRQRRRKTGPPPATVLLVEESPIIAKLVAQSISTLEDVVVEIASSAEDARARLASDPASLTAAVVDLEVGDAEEGEIVDLALAAGVPTVVLTSSYDPETRQRVVDRAVVDYFVKGEKSLPALNKALQRLRINPGVSILVVDDSAAFRLLTRRLLEAHRFRIVEATDGVEALEVLEGEPAVTLVVTDFEMPRMTGLELVAELRARRAREDLAVIGVSALGDRALPASYLKHGADDFLTKPFEMEEFYCRVYNSVTNVEQIQAIRTAAYTDQLTGLANRLHFFTAVPALYEEAQREGSPFALAMVDIDFFKKINDTYGHAGGDVALEHLARLFEESLETTDFVARFGGEEFCVLSPGLEGEAVSQKFEALRACVEGSPVDFEGQTIRFTLSIGVSVTPGESLDGVINHADELLYEAKEGGRNRVVIGEAGVAAP